MPTILQLRLWFRAYLPIGCIGIASAAPVHLVDEKPVAVIHHSLRAADLESGFRNPPPSAGIRCFWWWLNSNVTKEAITRDLEEMKAIP